MSRFRAAGRSALPQFCALLCVSILALASGRPASAQSCSVSAASGSYGSVDILSGGAVDTTATFTVTCGGIPLTTIGICVQITDGSPNPSSSIRSMGSGGSTVQHELYSNAARTQVWGSWGYAAAVYGSGGVAYNMALSVLGSGTRSFTVYGRFRANQQSAPPGTYSWNTTSPQIAYGYGATTCASQPVGNTASAGSSTWTSMLAANCLVSAGALNFGTAGLLTSNLDATGTLSVQCTSTTPYSMSLDNGANAVGSQRRMRLGATSNYINYGLFTNVARTSAWLTSASASSCTQGAGTCVLGTGTSLNQTSTVYGRVPPQTTPAPGAYADTVVMSVTY